MSRHKPYYPYLYKSYWYWKFNVSEVVNSELHYLSAIPHPGAGIGHQIANWIAGFWYAKQFGLKFAHVPFTNQKWENILNFHQGEALAEELIKKKGFKQVRLPLFNEEEETEIELIRDIIKSYANQKIVFFLEQDQFYKNQIGVQQEINEKFHQQKEIHKTKLIYSEDNYNIAVHVRRGDVSNNIGKNYHPHRWQDNNYYRDVISNYINTIDSKKPIKIYLFSQGVSSDFTEFSCFDNLELKIDLDQYDTFVNMVYADTLITSKSSFSYKPALLNQGIKICPDGFWHAYPESPDWIVVK